MAVVVPVANVGVVTVGKGMQVKKLVELGAMAAMRGSSLPVGGPSWAGVVGWGVVLKLGMGT